MTAKGKGLTRRERAERIQQTIATWQGYAAEVADRMLMTLIAHPDNDTSALLEDFLALEALSTQPADVPPAVWAKTVEKGYFAAGRALARRTRELREQENKRLTAIRKEQRQRRKAGRLPVEDEGLRELREAWDNATEEQRRLIYTRFLVAVGKSQVLSDWRPQVELFQKEVKALWRKMSEDDRAALAEFIANLRGKYWDETRNE